MKKRFFTAILLVMIMTTLIFASCKKDDESKTEDNKQETTKIELKDNELLAVNDERCLEGEGRFILSDMERMYGPNFDWTMEVKEGLPAYKAIKEDTLQVLKRFYTLKAVAKAEGIVLSEEQNKEIDTTLAAYVETNGKEKLEADGITEDNLRNIIEISFLAEEVKKLKTKDLKIDDAKKNEFMMRDPEYAYSQEVGLEKALEKASVQHILISTMDKEKKPLPEEEKKAAKKKAEEVLAKVEAGEDFAKLVEEFSEDPGKVQNKGVYTFAKNEPFVEEFKNAAFEMKDGESRIVETQFGYHIMNKIEQVKANEEAMTIAKNRFKMLEEQALEEQKNLEFQRLFTEEFENKYPVVVNQDLWDSIKTTYEKNGGEGSSKEESKKIEETTKADK